MISVHEASHLLQQALRTVEPESRELLRCGGMVVQESLEADRDYPPFDRVAMDGFALSSQSWARGRRSFLIQSVQKAGDEPQLLQNQESCIEIMTGAQLPRGCDSVIPYEDAQRLGEMMLISDGVKLQSGANVHRQGEDCPAGKRFEGELMQPPLAALAASFGYAQLRVSRPLRISILGTGDELVPIAQQPLGYQIRASNVHALEMALVQRQQTIVRKVLIPDQRRQIYETLLAALEDSDLVLVSGAVSVGAADFVPAVLQEIGVQKIFHGVAQRPGKPLWFGQVSGGASVFGLPGNPMAHLICAFRYVLPFIEGMQGRPLPPRPYALLPSVAPHRMTRFVPVRLDYTKDARILAEAIPHHGSGDFVALSQSQGFVEVPGLTEPQYDAEAACFPLYLW